MERIKNILTSTKLQSAFKDLEKIYKDIPNTTGCMDNIAKDGGCGAWCCFSQSPHVLYSEFLRTWVYVLKNWELEKIVDLIEKALMNYFSERTTKGCIFIDKEKKICTQHQTRPYNCRIYGITPESEFKPRYERLKVLYQNDVTADIRPQCNLIKTTKDQTVTENDTNRWWSELKEVEKSIGIDKKDMIDSPTGSYLSYHDHILMQLLTEDTLAELTLVKMDGRKEEKDMAIKAVVDHLKKALEKIKSVL